MRFPPLFLVPDYGKGDSRASSAPGGAAPDHGAADDIGTSAGPDYRHYTDEQLLEERERRLREPDEPTPIDRRSSVGDDRVDRITDELIRRARQRHPSARGRAV